MSDCIPLIAQNAQIYCDIIRGLVFHSGGNQILQNKIGKMGRYDLFFEIET